MRTTNAKTAIRPRLSGRILGPTLGLGSINIILYLLLFNFSDQLVALAIATKHGNELNAMIPMALAMLFAFIHGTFVDYLWVLLGLRGSK